MFNGDKDKARRVLKISRKINSKVKQDYNITDILEMLNIDLITFKTNLERIRDYDYECEEQIDSYNEGTLRYFCISNNYDYEVILKVIRLHELCVHDNFEQTINRFLTHNKNKNDSRPATWIYEKYGMMIQEVLNSLDLDSQNILNNMSKSIINLEEAIGHEIFLSVKKSSRNDWLEIVFKYLTVQLDRNINNPNLLADFDTSFNKLIKNYNLTLIECNILLDGLKKYIKTIKQYRIIDVGLETNPDKKLEKTIKYNLDEFDIEESFFIPLNFDNGVLLGKKSELYKRRQLLRQYIIDWDFYTDEEKEIIIASGNFNSEEIEKINSTRNEINELVEKSKTL